MKRRDETDGPMVEALVRRAQKGDARAFGDLVRRYRPRIFALALHVTGNESDADDVAQEVFLRAFRALGAFEGRGDFFHWIYRIALHLAFDLWRDCRRRSATPLDDPRVERAVTVDARGDPSRAAALRQIYGRLVVALDDLAPPLRATLILVFLHGLSQAEAAEVLGTTTSTIGWRIHKARARLRAAFGVASERRLPPPPGRDAALVARRPPPPLASADGLVEPREPDSWPFDLSSLTYWH